jgi:hypothetical protein
MGALNQSALLCNPMLRKIIYILFLIVLTLRANASTDSVDVRLFSDDKIREFKKQKEFQYDRNELNTESFMESLQRILRDFFDRNLNLPPVYGNTLAPLLFYGLLIFLLGLIIYYLAKGNLRWIFRKTDKVILTVQDITADNIHVIEYDKELDEAEKSGDFRRAVRLRYLETLKYLHDSGYILWTPEKTNDTLQREIVHSELRNKFARLRYHFEYVWYGEFIPDVSLYESIRAEFSTFKNSPEKIYG